MALSGTGVLGGTTITSLGTGVGGAGTYNINQTQTVTTTTITGTLTTPPFAVGSYIAVAGITPTGYIGTTTNQVTDCTTTSVSYNNTTTGAQTVAGNVTSVIPLTNASSFYQIITGTTFGAFSLPDTSTLQQGWTYRINNAISTTLNLYTSTGVSITSLAGGSTGYLTCINTSINTAAAWRFGVTEVSSATGTGQMVLNSGPTIVGTLNFTGSTTSSAFFGTSVTSAPISIGGLSGTGLISIGRATTSQPIQIGTSATTSATTASSSNGTIATTVLTIGATPTPTGTFSIGMAITGTGVSPGTYITSLGTGTGGAGTYNINQTQTVASATTITGTTQKSIDIGTGGLSGSITFITLGSATSGAISSVNINGTLNTGFNNANYQQFTGAAAGFVPVHSVVGSNTDISLALQSKGTGAIDLAAGSSGVNISNGGTVTALTATNSGSAYTSIPSIAITAPTTAGGVQATATVAMTHLSASTISNGGTGYSVNDTLTIVGGTTGSAATFTVTSVSGNVVTGITRLNTSTYTVLPSSPSATTVSPAGGTGCTIAVNWAINGSAFTISNAGSGYVEQPTVSFSGGGGGSGAAAYATVGSIPTIKTVGSAISFSTDIGELFRVTNSTGTTTSPAYINVIGGGSTNIAQYASGATSAISLGLVSKGTSSINFSTNGTAGNQQFSVSHTASAVNYAQVTGGATNNRPTLSSQGSDADIGFNIVTKGSGTHNFASDANIGTSQFQITRTQASAVNYLTATGAATSYSPRLYIQGSDTNIDLTLAPKGTGKVLVAFNNGLGFANATGNSVAYTYYNAGSNSIDTVFG
jgi:hypothetical protein